MASSGRTRAHFLLALMCALVPECLLHARAAERATRTFSARRAPSAHRTLASSSGTPELPRVFGYLPPTNYQSEHPQDVAMRAFAMQLPRAMQQPLADKYYAPSVVLRGQSGEEIVRGLQAYSSVLESFHAYQRADYNPFRTNLTEWSYTLEPGRICTTWRATLTVAVPPSLLASPAPAPAPAPAQTSIEGSMVFEFGQDGLLEAHSVQLTSFAGGPPAPHALAALGTWLGWLLPTTLGNLRGRSRFVDDFERLATLGVGQFSTVHKCRHKVDGQLYAVKVSRFQYFEGEKELALREVEALATLAQAAEAGAAHVVRYFGAWWEGERLHIQTELCASSVEGSMAAAGGPLPAAQCVSVLRQCLLGLALMHSRGMCHLDVKPANIFVARAEPGEEPVYKLGDLGVALLEGDAPEAAAEGDAKYLPRELRREDYSCLPRADIFSLGASVLEMALGRPLPEPGDGPEYQQIRNGVLPSDELCACPQELTALLRWMMHPDARQRPGAAELLAHPLFRSWDAGMFADFGAEEELLRAQERALSNIQ